MRLQKPERTMRLQKPERTKAERKILKPLVEKRRRDRMNRSLNSLKSLLLHAQDATARRVEKAEILEHTVLFLRSQRSGPQQSPQQEPSEQLLLSFQEGFSACLHRAAHFLEAGGKAPWLAPALDAALPLESDPGSVIKNLKKSPKTLLRELKQRRTLISATAKTNSSRAQRGALRLQAQSADCGENKSPSHGPQSPWRPWP